MIREAFQDLNRLRQIAIIAARYGFADLIERSGGWSRLGTKEVIDTKAEVRSQSAAKRFRLMLAELGPTFVKLGQVLSTRGDLLPAEIIDELATLQDQAPPVPIDEVHQQIRNAFGKDTDALFKSFEETPMAAASIAQVHRAVTLAGDDVVVKVQRPGITEQIRSDLSVLHSVARMLEAVIEEVGVYTPTGIIEEFDKAINEELDFVNEASNIRAFYKNYAGRTDAKIPKVYDELSGRTVLTMEFINAPKMSQAKLEDAGKQRLAEIILEGAFKQLFVDGLFHADPHPGNLLVLEGPVLAMIDFGLVGRVSRQMQETLISLVLAVGLKDSESVARLLYRIGAPDSRANLHAFRQDIDAILSEYLPANLKDINSRSLMRDILNLAVKYKIRIPKEYAILSRASVAVEGMLRTLFPDMPIGTMVLPYAKKLLADRYDPSQLEGGMMKSLLRLQAAATEVPLQLQQILLDLESGKFGVTVKSNQLDELNNNVRALAMIIFIGLCAAGCIVGTFISFASPTGPAIWGIPVMGILGIAGTVFLFSTAVVRQAWGSFRKFSLGRLIKRR